MKIIALEEHYSTPEINAAWKALPPELQDPITTNFGTGKIADGLLDMSGDPLGARLKNMDDNGIDVQVLSLTTPGVQSFDPAQSVDFARRCNDLAAELIAKRPDRFQGFAALPTPDPEAAAKELERCVSELGFKGAMLCGRTQGKNVDDPAQFAIYEAAASLKVPLYIHPQIPQPSVRDAYYTGYGDELDTTFATSGVGWHFETGIQAIRLILSGVFDRLPDLQIILGHWGELMAFYLTRLNSMSKLAHQLKMPVEEYYKQHVYLTPSGIYSQQYLRWAIEVMGVERILFALDYPFIDAPGGGSRQFLTDAALSDQDKELIAHGNWERLTSQA